MAPRNIADLSVFRNRQTQINEKITTYLWYLEALMDVVLTLNFFELTKNTMQGYFSLVAEVIENLIQLHQSNLMLSQEH